jgi:hypothetical protein
MIVSGRCRWCRQEVSGTAIRPWLTVTSDGRSHWLKPEKKLEAPTAVIESTADAEDGDRFPARPGRFDIAA